MYTILQKLIYSAAILGCLLLLAVTAVLAKLNWNDEIRGRLFSVVLGGAAALLIAVLTTLKPTSFQKSFVTAVPFDDLAGGPPLTGGVTSNPRWDELAMLAKPAIQQDGKTVVTIATPAPDERFSFCGELVQYEVIRRIRDLTRGGRWKVGITVTGAQASLSPEMKLSNGVEVAGTTYVQEIAKNRFYNGDLQRFYWKTALFTLPPSVVIQTDHHRSVDGSTEKFLVRLEKKMFFKYEIEISALPSTGPGAVPPQLQGHLPPEVQQRTSTYFFQITTAAQFERLTSGSKEAAEYREWLEWLSSMLQQQMT